MLVRKEAEAKEYDKNGDKSDVGNLSKQ